MPAGMHGSMPMPGMLNRVVVDGLQSAKAQRHNGMSGRVEALDQSTGRCRAWCTLHAGKRGRAELKQLAEIWTAVECVDVSFLVLS